MSPGAGPGPTFSSLFMSESELGHEMLDAIFVERESIYLKPRPPTDGCLLDSA